MDKKRTLIGMLLAMSFVFSWYLLTRTFSSIGAKSSTRRAASADQFFNDTTCRSRAGRDVFNAWVDCCPPRPRQATGGLQVIETAGAKNADGAGLGYV